MKKQKYYLAAGVLACSAISGLAMPLANTFAEGDLSGGSHDVTVGEVDETIYSVNINWGNLTFDWKYDSATNSFNFQPQTRCVGTLAGQNQIPTLQYYQNEGNLFSDNTCNTPVIGELASDASYYFTEPDGEIRIEDFTQNGRIKSTASFAAEAKYSWIIGKFGSWVRSCSSQFDIVTECSMDFYEQPDSVYFNSNIIDPESGAEGRLFLSHLNLEKNIGPNNPVNAEEGPITKDDKIGTVTITIEPDLN